MNIQTKILTKNKKKKKKKTKGEGHTLNNLEGSLCCRSFI